MENKEVTVSQDGSGDFKTVQEAIDSVPIKNESRIVIRVSPGVYKQPVHVPKTKDFITLVGLRPEDTILTFDNTVNTPNPNKEGENFTTYWCGSVIVEGKNFIAENITFENSAPEGSHQAVALRVSGDQSAFYNCRLLGWQDTLYLDHGKQYLKDCYIEGHVDFIFGNGTALLENCHIHSKAAGWITAQSRTEADMSTGFVFLRCVITGNGESSYTCLGRPWRPYARVVYAYTYMDKCIKAEGWDTWDNDTKNETTACFYEHRCFGPGSNQSDRLAWAKQLSPEEAEQILSQSFIDPDSANSWLIQKMASRIPHSA